MENVLTIIFVVIIAAVIGGVTNYLAIKMLFHPRKPIVIGNWKLPFTPGLIPKRKDQIAVALGRVVSEYLVTPERIAGALQKSELKEKLVLAAERWMEEKLASGMTLGEWLESWIGEERFDQMRERQPEQLQEWIHRGIAWLWEEKQLSSKKLKDCLPGWNEEKKERWIASAAEMLLQALRDELQSVNGERTIRHLVNAFLDRAGGWLGALAGIFMDEEKLVAKVRIAALEQLDQLEVKHAVQLFLLKKADKLEEKTLQEAVEWMSGQDALPWLEQKSAELLRWQEWSGRLYEKPLKDLVEPWKDAAVQRLPLLIEWLLQFAAKHVHKAVHVINLPELVEAQVAEFPVERVEQVVLSISGKEFRAITWLGALLGGMIGLFQSLFFLFGR